MLDSMKLWLQIVQFKLMKKQRKMGILHGECHLHFSQTLEAVFNAIHMKECLIYILKKINWDIQREQLMIYWWLRFRLLVWWLMILNLSHLWNMNIMKWKLILKKVLNLKIYRNIINDSFSILFITNLLSSN